MEHTRSARWGIASVLAVALVALSACGGDGDGGDEGPSPDPADDGPRELIISNYENYMPEDTIPAFEEATGVDVKVVNHTSNEEVVGKFDATGGDPGFDLAVIAGPFAQGLAARGWVAEIDHAQIPNMESLSPEATQLPYDVGNRYSVPYTWGTTGLCYRSDLVDEEIDSWNDLLDPAPELEGKITMVGTDRWLLLPALKVLGYSANTTNEQELEEAGDLLKETKKSLLAYDDTTFFSRLVAGEAWLVQAWDGWCNYAIAEDPNVEWVVPEEGSDVWVDVFAVPESAEHKDEAFEFINFILDPEVHASVAELVYYNVPNPEAMEMVDPKLLKQFDNLGISAAELHEGAEPLVDVSAAGPVWSRIVSEIKAS
ncbi:MAG: spermidine/putrescine ABC transporter substrate-binding protein [Actinomycetota bacterium]